MNRALITGATGFAGSYLAEYCVRAGWEVHGTAQSAASGVEIPFAHGAIQALDLCDAAAIEALVAEVQPDRVFHLAAQAALGVAWADPAATLTNNIISTLRVLEAVRLRAPTARVLIVGSAEEYGRVSGSDLPVAEGQALRPGDPYGVSKVATDMLGLQHFLAHGTHVVRVRPFNHIGPRQRQGFVLADFAARLAAIERGEAAPVLRVGNVQAARDFTDVRDIVRGYFLALEGGQAGAVYNVCSGRAIRISDLLDRLLAESTLPVRVERDPGLQRLSDHPTMVGSYQALREATGWAPQIPFEQTVSETLHYWRGIGRS